MSVYDVVGRPTRSVIYSKYEYLVSKQEGWCAVGAGLVHWCISAREVAYDGDCTYVTKLLVTGGGIRKKQQRKLFEINVNKCKWRVR